MGRLLWQKRNSGSSSSSSIDGKAEDTQKQDGQMCEWGSLPATEIAGCTPTEGGKDERLAHPRKPSQGFPRRSCLPLEVRESEAGKIRVLYRSEAGEGRLSFCRYYSCLSPCLELRGLGGRDLALRKKGKTGRLQLRIAPRILRRRSSGALARYATSRGNEPLSFVQY